tara:strand:+ start:139 stop:891 length:753 start_codon:yes stop_codon:yes gene_type:complete
MYDVIKALSLPPANLVLVMLVGLLLRRRAKRVGTAITVAAAVSLYLLSTSFFATRLVYDLETEIAGLPGAVADDPQAIVVLSAGYSYTGLDKEQVNDDAMTLERLRKGAQLHRKTGLPILVTGGGVAEVPVPVGTLMARTLRTDFGIDPKWVETQSTTTYENAEFSARILRNHAISTVYLVSQAWHLPRATAAFQAAGLSAIPAPSSTSRLAPADIRTFIPSAKALQASYHVFHEWLGLVWYRWALFGRD